MQMNYIAIAYDAKTVTHAYTRTVQAAKQMCQGSECCNKLV